MSSGKSRAEKTRFDCPRRLALLQGWVIVISGEDFPVSARVDALEATRIDRVFASRKLSLVASFFGT
jgi:hypothetical protein